jgi:hypothetical protein
MSDQFDGLDEREKAAVEGALNRGRAIADQIAIKLRHAGPVQFADKLLLADFHTALERAADALRQTGQPSDPTVKDSQARGSRRHDIEGDLRLEINLVLLRAGSERFFREQKRANVPFESRSGKLKMQQKLCRR